MFPGPACYPLCPRVLCWASCYIPAGLTESVHVRWSCSLISSMELIRINAESLARCLPALWRWPWGQVWCVNSKWAWKQQNGTKENVFSATSKNNLICSVFYNLTGLHGHQDLEFTANVCPVRLGCCLNWRNMSQIQFVSKQHFSFAGVCGNDSLIGCVKWNVPWLWLQLWYKMFQLLIKLAELDE